MANSTIKAYYRSYIDQDIDGYTLSGDFTSAANVTDRLKTTYAITSGFGTDGVSAEIIADMTTDRSVDTVMLKSNFKNFIIYKWTGAAWSAIETYWNNANENLIVFSFTAFDTQKIKIACTETIVANQEKKIYLLEITKTIGEITPQKIDIEQDYQEKDLDNIYGGSIQVIKYPNYPKVKIDLSFKNLQSSDYTVYALFKAMRKIDSYVVWVYFSDDYALLGPNAWYLVNDLSPFESTPSENHLSAGVEAKIKLREC